MLDLVAAPALLEALLGRRGEKLVLDGAAVSRVGGQCLQVLLAARAAWAVDGQTLFIDNMSEDFEQALELLGVTPEKLTFCKEISA